MQFIPRDSDSLTSGSFRLTFKLGLVECSFLLEIYCLPSYDSEPHVYSRSIDLFTVYLAPGSVLDSGNTAKSMIERLAPREYIFLK